MLHCGLKVKLYLADFSKIRTNSFLVSPSTDMFLYDKSKTNPLVMTRDGFVYNKCDT